jgi:phosphinothricin acetyltransferase
VVIRDATAADADALLAIYAPFVRETAVSFELEPPTVDAFAERIARSQSRWAWLVAEHHGRVAGYAYASAFRERAAYRFSVEMSAYLAPGSRGNGIGRALYESLFAILITKGYCSAFAGVTIPNDSSVRFHRALGFTEVGVFRRAGWKLGAWHDVSWWQRPLQDGPPRE